MSKNEEIFQMLFDLLNVESSAKQAFELLLRLPIFSKIEENYLRI